MLSMKGDNKLQLGWEHNYRLRFKDFDKKIWFYKKNMWNVYQRIELTKLQLAFSWPQKAYNIG